MALDMNQYLIFIFVSCRITGAIFFNPVFGRWNIPGIVKIGLSMGIALSAAYQLDQINLLDYTVIETLLTLIKEFVVGYTMGFIMALFLSIFHIGGEVMDLQIGLGMASLYDPNTNSQISIIGNLITTMYVLLFFITHSHINFMAVAVKSFNVIPLGTKLVADKIGIYMIELFGYILVYAIQLALPIIVTQIVVEMAVGILMRVVPNINVFVVNLQLKLGVGIIVILTIIPALVKYLEKLNALMLTRVQEGLIYLL
jgi:flagellar biosynthetic protein FliR